jgi:hypothetical protein
MLRAAWSRMGSMTPNVRHASCTPIGARHCTILSSSSWLTQTQQQGFATCMPTQPRSLRPQAPPLHHQRAQPRIDPSSSSSSGGNHRAGGGRFSRVGALAVMSMSVVGLMMVSSSHKKTRAAEADGKLNKMDPQSKPLASPLLPPVATSPTASMGVGAKDEPLVPPAGGMVEQSLSTKVLSDVIQRGNKAYLSTLTQLGALKSNVIPPDLPPQVAAMGDSLARPFFSALGVGAASLWALLLARRRWRMKRFDNIVNFSLNTVLVRHFSPFASEVLRTG